jgi:hypothetical protein
MSHVGRARSSQAARAFAGAVLLSGLLVGCGRGTTDLAVTGLPPAVPAPPVPTTSFQGSVAAVDAEARILVVNVSIVWTPVIKGGAHERRVLIDHQTRWDPGPVELGDLLVGDEVQVEALDDVEGVWPAVKVQLLDID